MDHTELTSTSKLPKKKKRKKKILPTRNYPSVKHSRELRQVWGVRVSLYQWLSGLVIPAKINAATTSTNHFYLSGWPWTRLFTLLHALLFSSVENKVEGAVRWSPRYDVRFSGWSLTRQTKPDVSRLSQGIQARVGPGKQTLNSTDGFREQEKAQVTWVLVSSWFWF